MKRFKKIKGLLLFNWQTLLLFELLYKLAAGVVFAPLLWQLFNLILRLSGNAYLAPDNLLSFAEVPLVCLLLPALIVCAAMLALIDVSAVVFILDQSAAEEKVHLTQVIQFSVGTAIRVWKPRNFLLVVVLLLLLPFLNIGLGSSLYSTLSIPEFISDYIQADWRLFFLLNLLTLLLDVLMMRWLYAFHYFTLEGCAFREARRRSVALSRKRRIRDFITLLLLQFLGSFFTSVLLAVLLVLALLVMRLFQSVFVLRWLTSTLLWGALGSGLMVSMALSTPASYAVISVLFYLRKGEKEEEIIHAQAPACHFSEKMLHRLHMAYAATGILLTVCALALGYMVNSGRLDLNLPNAPAAELTAHRGASVYFPENTMAAFRGAADLGADWIELDVQQSRDGQIVVSHDSNFSRTAGVDQNVWEMDYAEVAALDVGRFFSEEYAGEHPPLLSEVAELSRQRHIRLNIELKPTGHETDFEKAVVDVVRQAGIADSCVLTSLDYSVLERIKAYDPSIRTVYVMSLAYGSITDLAAADDYSVEASSVTDKLVTQVHDAGGQLFVWTVNTEESIKNILWMDVDNIITDNIELARQCILESRFNESISDYLDAFRQ